MKFQTAEKVKKIKKEKIITYYALRFTLYLLSLQKSIIITNNINAYEHY